MEKIFLPTRFISCLQVCESCRFCTRTVPKHSFGEGSFFFFFAEHLVSVCFLMSEVRWIFNRPGIALYDFPVSSSFMLFSFRETITELYIDGSWVQDSLLSVVGRLTNLRVLSLSLRYDARNEGLLSLKVSGTICTCHYILFFSPFSIMSRAISSICGHHCL